MIDVIQTRGGCIEAVHPCSVAVACDGRAELLTGHDAITTFRSAAKPFQLAVSLEALGDPSLAPEDLAIGAASHSAEPVHVARVEALLARFGLDPSGLRCGAHPPIHVPSAEAVLRGGGRFSDLHNNCSGKHTFMLAASARQGWARDYRPVDHPLQRRNRARLADWMACEPDTAVDGCGVPTFIQPLTAVARGWWQLARAMRERGEGTVTDAWRERLGRVGLAMAQHPSLTSGAGRLDLDVARGARETMAVKIGAMGLFCIAIPQRDMAIALKVHSGVGEALPALVAWAMARAAPDAWREPSDWALREVRNVVGDRVGAWSVREGGISSR